MSETENNPVPITEAPTIQAQSADVWWQRLLTQWVKSPFPLLALALFSSLSRTYLDISENFSGMESRAIRTWGFIGLWFANILAAVLVVFLVHFFLPKLSNQATPAGFKRKHLGYFIVYVFFLPAFLSMDLKAAQFFPSDNSASAEDQTKLGLQDIYNEFTQPFRRDINAAVRKEILLNTKSLALHYGCEKGIELFQEDLEIEVRGGGNLDEEAKQAAEDEINAILTREPTDDRRAKALAELAIATFGLDHVKNTFTNDVCIWQGIANGYACELGLLDMGDKFDLALDQSTLSPEEMDSERAIIQRNLERDSMSDMNKALRIVNKSKSLFGEKFTQDLFDENLCIEVN